MIVGTLLYRSLVSVLLLAGCTSTAIGPHGIVQVRICGRGFQLFLFLGCGDKYSLMVGTSISLIVVFISDTVVL